MWLGRSSYLSSNNNICESAWHIKIDNRMEKPLKIFELKINFHISCVGHVLSHSFFFFTSLLNSSFFLPYQFRIEFLSLWILYQFTLLWLLCWMKFPFEKFSFRFVLVSKFVFCFQSMMDLRLSFKKKTKKRRKILCGSEICVCLWLLFLFCMRFFCCLPPLLLLCVYF